MDRRILEESWGFEKGYIYVLALSGGSPGHVPGNLLVIKSLLRYQGMISWIIGEFWASRFDGLAGLVGGSMICQFEIERRLKKQIKCCSLPSKLISQKSISAF
ncbi:uncharacterized protein BDR25DRAFT_354826 [Lindgomyces ingoldianus]|uniref:Uncharacterized protein n=1 Tax=Lindgomyces ingoldianus TaxID=673940 RepID=A0ACB6QV30_9PLEO|nr:uncharacterized protein BDR25DRAFT_354826 [Lindgomyces ingoldianus]KAF2470879.1 hypothetical protein BDR25DRAFT_354826 [Lindgomyces ingoldianus]